MTGSRNNFFSHIKIAILDHVEVVFSSRLRSLSIEGSRDGAVVRALTSVQ